MKKYIIQNWVLIAICVILAGWLISKIENEKVLSGKLDTFNVQLESYKLKDGKIVNTTKTVTYEKVPEKTELTKKFSEVKTIIKIQERLRVDTIRVVYRDSIPCDFDIKGSIVDKDYSVDYSSSNKGLSLYNLKVVDTIEIVTGVKRKWLLGKKTNTIDISHSNKLMTTDDIKHFEIVEKKKFYDTTLFKVAAGIIFGVVVIK